MSHTVNVHEAKTHFSKLLEQAHQGEEIIVAKAGKPYARLMPLADAPKPRRPGRLAGRVGGAFFDPLPDAYGETAAESAESAGEKVESATDR
jgi:prevent-host-death family protein